MIGVFMVQLFDGTKVHQSWHNENDEMPPSGAIFISTET